MPRSCNSRALAASAAVAESDVLVGRLVAGLERLGRLANTVVVVTSDHGETIGEAGLFFNHDANLREPTVRVPLILHAPNRGAGVIEQISRSIDLLPTVVALAGLEAPAGIDGTSLLPQLVGTGLDLVAFVESRPLVEPRRALAHYPLELPGVEGKLRMIRRGPGKLAVYPRAEGYEVELFDLTADPGETLDLAPSQPELARSLTTELEKWFAGYQDADIAPLELEDEDLESLRALGYVD